MKLLIDTSILIDHLRGRSEAVTLLSEAAHDGTELWSVTVVRTEILAGMRSGESRRTNLLLNALRWHDVTAEIADHAGRLASQFLRTHPGVDTVDYLVAATAELLPAELYTLNLKHFPMFPELRAPY